MSTRTRMTPEDGEVVVTRPEDQHTHHWVPRPMVGGVLSCVCGATCQDGQVIVRTLEDYER